jgi:sugar fermentation stimulation protein A
MSLARIDRAAPVVEGTLLARRMRFLADVALATGEQITAMCSNTGSMKSCNEPGRPVILSDSGNDQRKYRYTWELIHMGESWVNVNTGLPNSAVERFVALDAFPELAGYPFSRREVKYGKDGASRIDLLLSNTPPPRKRKKDRDPEPRCAISNAQDCYVEVKNTSMREGEFSMFPDSVTERGQKHLNELTSLANRGVGAAMLFFCGRTDTAAFRPADEIDPEYGRLLRKAARSGVKILPYQFLCAADRVELIRRLPLEL